MRKATVALLVGFGMLLTLAGCGGQSEEEEFKSNFEGAIKAAEQGKELVKSPGKKRR